MAGFPSIDGHEILNGKWFAYTLLVGLIPVLTRLLVWAASTADQISPVVAPDLIALGLVLHTSCINEIARLPERESEWKAMQTGIALLMITLYGALYTLAIIGDTVGSVINGRTVITSSIIIAGISTVLCTMVLHRLAKRGQK